MSAKDQAYQSRQGGRYQIDPETGKRERVPEAGPAPAAKPGTKSGFNTGAKSGAKAGAPVKTDKES